MKDSMALFEFTSMSEGLKFTNDCLKNADLTLEQNRIMCPGKYVALLVGQTQQVETAIRMAKDGYKTLVGCEKILKLHPKTMEVFNKEVAFTPNQNYGIIETKQFVISIKMADAIAKGSNVTLEKVYYRLGLVGKGMVIFSGSSADLNMAKKLIESEFNPKDLVAVELLHTVKENIFNV